MPSMTGAVRPGFWRLALRRNAERAQPLVLVLLLVALGACDRRLEPVLEPAEWNLGSIPSTQVARTEIAVRNPGPRAVGLRLVSTCDCLRAEAAPEEVAGGETARLRLAYDPAGQSGFVEAGLIVVALRGGAESRAALRVYGKVLPAGKPVP